MHKLHHQLLEDCVTNDRLLFMYFVPCNGISLQMQYNGFTIHQLVNPNLAFQFIGSFSSTRIFIICNVFFI